MKKTIAVTTFALTLLLASLSAAAQTQSREDVLTQIQIKRAELAALENSFLSPSDADRQDYAAFLGGAGTGMIRLLPRGKYDGNSRDSKKALSINGGGAYYSFTRETHEYGYGSDIQLESGMFSVGFAGADYGMFLNVGDVSLDQLTNAHPAVRALLEYTPPVKEADVRAEYQRTWQGIDLSGFKFKKSVSARPSNSYLLRSISPERSDIAVAFRVLREDVDGSVILVYKILKKFPSPDFERAKTAGLN